LEREPKIRARPGHIDWREQVADRLEGRPVPKLQQPVPHATYFYKAGGPTPREVESADHDHAPLQTAHPEVAEGDENVPGYISVPRHCALRCGPSPDRIEGSALTTVRLRARVGKYSWRRENVARSSGLTASDESSSSAATGPSSFMRTR
jgi:hypothetical protein